MPLLIALWIGQNQNSLVYGSNYVIILTILILNYLPSQLSALDQILASIYCTPDSCILVTV